MLNVINMNNKLALIPVAAGFDHVYLVEYLLKKGYIINLFNCGNPILNIIVMTLAKLPDAYIFW